MKRYLTYSVFTGPTNAGGDVLLRVTDNCNVLSTNAQQRVTTAMLLRITAASQPAPEHICGLDAAPAVS